MPTVIPPQPAKRSTAITSLSAFGMRGRRLARRKVWSLVQRAQGCEDEQLLARGFFEAFERGLMDGSRKRRLAARFFGPTQECPSASRHDQRPVPLSGEGIRNGFALFGLLVAE